MATVDSAYSLIMLSFACFSCLINSFELCLVYDDITKLPVSGMKQCLIAFFAASDIIFGSLEKSLLLTISSISSGLMEVSS